MSRSMSRRGFFLAAIAVTGMLAIAGPALSDGEGTTQRSEGKLVALDPAAGTITVQKWGKKVVYQALFEGSVLTRTTATMNAKPVKLATIPIDADVIVYWRADENDSKVKHARKVDAPDVADEGPEQRE